jgi:hypothetical protein
VTRPHHPLQGKEVVVLVEGRGDELTVELPDHSTMRIPRKWTDADGAGTDSPERPPAVFTVEALRELVELVAALRQRT